MDSKLKKKVWKVLRLIAQNNGSPVVIAQDFQKISNDFLVKQFISFCSLWKYYLGLLEKDEEYEVCAEILRIVDIQKGFLLQIASHSGVKEPDMENQLDIIRNSIIETKPIG